MSEQHEHGRRPHEEHDRGHDHKPEHDDRHGHELVHLRPHLRADVCERCGANEHVHDGLCRRCRQLLIGEGELLETGYETPPHQAHPAPLHNPPWRRRGG